MVPPERELSIIEDGAFDASLNDLQTLMTKAGRPELGLLGMAPEANQHVVRESVAFLGGGAAALLQVPLLLQWERRPPNSVLSHETKERERERETVCTATCIFTREGERERENRRAEKVTCSLHKREREREKKGREGHVQSLQERKRERGNKGRESHV